LCYKFPMRYTY